ncbi:MAG TPA: primosomal protein N' [Steroidobacteraceae bacterium]|nr:primosomal protein N' [Steroidobacteraceae bacterium]
MSAAVLRIALDMPLRRLFDYLPPPEMALSQSVGQRVRVPFGRQRLVGLVMEHADSSDLPPARLKAVLEVLDAEPLLDRSAVELLRWAAEYYHHPIGEVIAAAIPKALRQGAPLIAMEERWTATAEGAAAAAKGEPRRAPKQRELLQILLTRGGASASELSGGLMESWHDAARALAKRGWIASTERPLLPADAPDAEAGAPLSASHVTADSSAAPTQDPMPDARTRAPVLAPEQAAAVARVSDSLGRFAPFILHGITGSGKTEVYLQVVERVLARGQRALVLVPEIGLTPQLVSRFRERFKSPLAVLHSGLTDGERLQAWRSAYTGHARVVLGTRSAVFAPVPELGVIVVDEEHDASFKQHEGGFRYSARDLAVVRAQQAGVPIVLGSATPALETLHNVSTGRYERLSLPRRAAQAVPPRVTLVDLRTSAVQGGISTPAVQAIERHLADDGQVLVFLNRRGYAPTLLCTACGWVAPCRDCDARLTVHRASERLRCHHCGADAPLPTRCPQCGFLVKPVGQGTERIEEALAQLFPTVPLVRLDRDVVRKRGDMEAAMRRMHSGEARILVGTQMVTKGHDFPNVTLVIVLNADQGLFSTDFRAPERLAQTIVQVAGRAGRGTKPGEVLIQTEFPEHPLLLNLLNEGYDGFARVALEERAQAAWPPFSRLAALRDSAPTSAAALEFLTDARRLMVPPRSIQMRGPVPAAMAKRAGRYHAQLLLESTDRTALHRFLAAWLPEVEQLKSARRVRWALDVDPIELF